MTLVFNMAPLYSLILALALLSTQGKFFVVIFVLSSDLAGGSKHCNLLYSQEAEPHQLQNLVHPQSLSTVSQVGQGFLPNVAKRLNLREKVP